MTTPIITIHNVETGEVEIREMNETELLEAAAEKVANDVIKDAQAEAEAAKESAKAKLAALGLTTDDLKALGL
jgi:hypothetical protein